MGSREGVAVAGLGGILQAVGVCVHSGSLCIGGQLVLRVAADQLAAVLHNGVLGAEVLQVNFGNADGHVFDAGHLIVIHLDRAAVGLGNGTLAPAVSRAVGSIKGLAIIRPVRHGVGAAIGGVNHSSLLETAAVQTMVGGSTGHRVKAAHIVLIMAVQLSGRGGIAGGIHILVCPVLVPIQSSVQIRIEQTIQ